jgi:hypothetical protein
MLNLSNQEFMTMEQVKTKASSIFTSAPKEGLSKHYSHIPTSQVIEDMDLLGWKVVDAKQIKSRKGEGYQKHLVVFRNPDISINGEDGDVVFPQVLLTNSHDGKSSFTFTAGLFRLICENGLVVATQEFDNIKIRHMGYDFSELQTTIKNMVEALPLTVDSLNKMKQTELEEAQIIEFATQAVNTRFNKDDISVDIKALIEPVREEDSKNDLWTVFNRVQERLLNGDFLYSSNNKTRKARPIKNFQQDIKLNQELYSLALQYAN